MIMQMQAKYAGIAFALIGIGFGALAQSPPSLAGRYADTPDRSSAYTLVFKSAPIGYLLLIDNQEVPLLALEAGLLAAVSEELFKSPPQQTQLACYNMDTAFVCRAKSGLLLPGAQKPLEHNVFLVTESSPRKLKAQPLYKLP